MPWIADAREAVMRSCRGVSRCCVCHPVAVMIIASSSEPMPQIMSTLFDSSKMPQVTLAARFPSSRARFWSRVYQAMRDGVQDSLILRFYCIVHDTSSCDDVSGPERLRLAVVAAQQQYGHDKVSSFYINSSPTAIPNRADIWSNPQDSIHGGQGTRGQYAPAPSAACPHAVRSADALAGISLTATSLPSPPAPQSSYLAP